MFEETLLHDARIVFPPELNPKTVGQRYFHVMYEEKLSDGGEPCWCQVRNIDARIFEKRFSEARFNL